MASVDDTAHDAARLATDTEVDLIELGLDLACSTLPSVKKMLDAAVGASSGLRYSETDADNFYEQIQEIAQTLRELQANAACLAKRLKPAHAPLASSIAKPAKRATKSR